MPYLWGKALPEFTCDYLCCILFCNGLTSENERGSNSSETLCSLPAITRPWMWGSIPERLKVQVNLTSPIPLKECPGDLAQGIHVVVNSQALESDRKPNPYNY